MAYPFAIVFTPGFTGPIVAFLALLWAAKFYFSGTKFDVFVACFFASVFFLSDAKFLYPVIVNAFLAITFFASLNKTPMITRFAMMQRGGLDDRGLKYTRKLTKIWCVFFVLNAAISYGLSLIQNKNAWAIYTGALAYVLVGALISGEILYRRFVLKI